jgi:CRISPR-associated protein Csx17
MKHRVILKGCTVEPMASYLKALAVLRLVSEQADPSARGWWGGNTFCLESRFDDQGLLNFFLDEYSPTPIIAPWNGGSGFSEGDRRDGINSILASDSSRFAQYRRTIEEVLSWAQFGTAEMTLDQILHDVRRAAGQLRPGKAQNDLCSLISDFESAASANRIDISSLHRFGTEEIKKIAKPVYKAVTKLRTAAKKNRRAGGKEVVVRMCRNRLGDASVDWIDSAVVLRTNAKLMYPPILGTGGSEGRLDYTNSFMERVSSLLLPAAAKTEGLLRNSIFREQTSELVTAAVGQLDPGRAGGYNQGPEIETKDFPSNPWDFVLAMEGAVVWASGAARRQGVASHGVGCSPFTVRSRAVGYGSAKDTDEAASRAEVWMPIWSRPSRFEEVRLLMREGRAEWGGKPVEDAMQFAEAAASLGTQRGIRAFQRYSMIKRRGDSFLALPLGCVPVEERKNADLLEDVDRVLARIDRFAWGFRSNEPPPQFTSRRRQVDAAVFEFVLRGGPERLLNILVALGRMEQYFAQRDLGLEPSLDAPLGGLSVRWLVAANDESVDFRLAVALASIIRTGDVGSIRANLTPINPEKPWAWAKGGAQTAWKGNGLAPRMVAVLRRRLIDGGRLRCDSLPLVALMSVYPDDSAAFITEDGIDESRIEDLLFGLSLLDWNDKNGLNKVKTELRSRPIPERDGPIIPRSYALLKHLFQANRGHPELEIHPESDILSLLLAHRTGDACQIAKRRLRVSGFAPVDAIYPDGENGTRLAASLLIPIRSTSMKDLSRLVLHEQEHVVGPQTKG